MGAVCRLRSVPARNLSCPLPMPLPNTDPTAPASETLTVVAPSPPAGVQPMVFVDLETTGGNATMDRITEIGIVELHADGTRTNYNNTFWLLRQYHGIAVTHYFFSIKFNTW